MKPLKRLLKSKAGQKIIVLLLAFYIRLVFITGRKTYDIHPDAQKFMRGDDNAIFAFWHGRMMLLPAVCPPKRQMHVLISLHRDGILISDVIAQFNQRTIGGSTSKGGRAALIELLRILKAGDNISITPDGPRGPNQIAASGVASVAKISGKAILPVTFSAKKYHRMRSWDRFMVALPFTHIIFCVSAPIMIEREADDETARVMIETAMNQLCDKADAAIL